MVYYDTWREALNEEMAYYGESLDETPYTTTREEDGFDDEPTDRSNTWFYLWTKDRVYYPHEYDSMMSIHSVPRNPTT